MAIREIVTLGFGHSSPVGFIPTLGYAGAGLIAPSMPGIEFALGLDRTHFKVSDSRSHFRLGTDRTHFDVKEE